MLNPALRRQDVNGFRFQVQHDNMEHKFPRCYRISGNDIKNSDANGQVSSLTITDEFKNDIENEMTDRNVSEFQ